MVEDQHLIMTSPSVINGNDDEKSKITAFPNDYIPANQLNLGFPVYAVEFIPKSSTLLIAGGGGPGRTGIRNAIVSLKMRNILPIIEIFFIGIISILSSN